MGPPSSGIATVLLFHVERELSSVFFLARPVFLRVRAWMRARVWTKGALLRQSGMDARCRSGDQAIVPGRAPEAR